MTKYVRLIFPIVLVFMAAFPIRSGAAGTRIIEGHIYDEDLNPLAGIKVLLSLDGRFIGGVATDQAGWFILEFQPGDNDICCLNICPKNHRGVFSAVELTDDTTYVEFNLEAIPREMVYMGEDRRLRETWDPPAAILNRLEHSA